MLPPYWPHLAPVEVIFGILKRKIVRLEKGNLINFRRSIEKKGYCKYTKRDELNITVEFMGEAGDYGQVVL